MSVLDDLSAQYNLLSTEQGVDLGDRIRSLKHRIANEAIEKKKFPVECFPPVLAEFMKGYAEVYDAPTDHYGLCFLTAIGAAIGNTARIDDRGTAHPAVFYAALVDLPGSGKTPTMETVLKPFLKRERQLLREYQNRLKEAAAEQLASGNDVTVPTPEQLLFNDFTLESLVDGLQASPRGIFAYHDEIEGFLSAMDKYRSGKGGDGPFWLSAHTGSSYKNNRRNRVHPVFLPMVFCPFIGGIQPGLLEHFSNDSRDSSGFLARILFSIPPRTIKQPYHNMRPDPGHALRWEMMVNRLFDLKPLVNEFLADGEPNEEPHIILLDDKAKRVYQAFYNGLAEKVNATEDTTTRSTLVKFETHALRIALVLHFADWAAQEQNKKDLWLGSAYKCADGIVQDQISGTCMERAIRIAEYFMATGLEVVGRLSAPYKSLPEHQQMWYESLSEEPTATECKELGQAMKDPDTGKRLMSDSTINRLLKNKELFTRKGRGAYLKLH